LRRSRKLVKKQRDQLKFHEHAMESTKEGITISDPSQPDNPMIYVNKGFERMTGYDSEEIIGKNCRFLQGPDTDEDKVDRIREAVKREEPIDIRLKNYTKNDEPFWNQLSITPVRNDEGELTHFVGIQMDVTEVKELEDELRKQAKYDSLTGLLNRGELMNQLEKEFERARRYDINGSLIILDLDHFKKINDRYGHIVGDRVLSSVGNLLEEEKRTNDICGRYGGEEFCLYLPETELDRAHQMAERLRQSIETMDFSAGESNFSVTASFGVSNFHTEEDSVTGTLKAPDRALYEAKNNGRNQIVVYE